MSARIPTNDPANSAGLPATATDPEKKHSLLIRNLKIMLVLLALMWVLEIIDSVFLGQGLNRYGILPRTTDGLLGIFFAPLLHGGFAHLSSNSVPFFVLGFLVLSRGMKTFLMLNLYCVVLGGFLVWLVSPGNTVHIGASGVIFGYFAYLLLSGIFERRLVPILVSLLVGFLYGGILAGVLPGQEGISWQGHLFGALAGAVYAWHTRRPWASKQDEAKAVG